MSEFTKAVVIANIFRYLLIATGFGFGYLGYRLFLHGYFERSGELKAKFGENHLLLKQVAPGVFFAALGVLIIAVGVVRRMEITVPVGGSNATLKDSFQKPCGDAGANVEIYRGKDGYPEKTKKPEPTTPQK